MADPIEIKANQIIDADKQNLLGLSDKAYVLAINAACCPGRVINGKATVTTAATAVALGTSTVLVNGVSIKALNANTGIIYVGKSGVTSANGYELNAGEGIFIACDDLSKIYINSNINNQSVCFVGG